MTTWLQLAVALISLTTAGVSAYQQVRKRYRSHTTLAPHGVPGATSPAPSRPVLNGFTEILREALDKLDILRKENEQLRIRVAELEAAAMHRQPRSARRQKVS